jgi:hypothetical protein
MKRHLIIKRQFIKRRAPREHMHASVLMSWVRAQRPISPSAASPLTASKIGHESGNTEKRAAE